MQAVLNIGGIHLALHDGFAANRTGGYWIALRATPAQVKPADMRVKDHQLRIANSYNPAMDSAMTVYDYMLFRLEVTEIGPDPRSLPKLYEPMQKSYRALQDMDETKADAFYQAAIVAAHEALELTTVDRRRVKLQLKDDYGQLKIDLGLSALSGPKEYEFGLAQAVPRSAESLLRGGEPSFDELFNV